MPRTVKELMLSWNSGRRRRKLPKDCEKADAQLEEWEKEEKPKGLERGSDCVNVDSLEREK